MTIVQGQFGLLAGLSLLAAIGGVAVAVGELNALYLAASLAACIAILFDFRIGVVMLILLMPISASQMFPHAMFGIRGLNPLNLLLVATLGSHVLAGLSDRRLREFVPPSLLWLYVVPVVGAAAIGTSHLDKIASIFLSNGDVQFTNVTGYLVEFMVKPLFMVLFALLVAAAVSRSKAPERFLTPALGSVWIMGLMVIVYVVYAGVGLDQLASSESREFLSPLGLHANELGRLYTFAYALLLFSWGGVSDRKVKLMLLVSMGLVTLALVLTFSRAAFLGFAIVNLLYLVSRRNNMKTLILGAVAGVIVFFLIPDAIYERMSAGFGGGVDAISAGRVDRIWLPLLPSIMDSPFFGSGLGSILWSEPMRSGGGQTILAVTHPHNAYLQALLDTGMVGLILQCAFFVHVWRGFRKLGDRPVAVNAGNANNSVLPGFYLGAAAGLLGILVSNFTDSSLTPRPEQAFLWLAIGMMYGQLRRTESAKAPAPSWSAPAPSRSAPAPSRSAPAPARSSRRAVAHGRLG